MTDPAAADDLPAALEQQLADLEQTRKDFLATASHELRTPITNILGYAALLAEDTELPSMHRQIIGRIERNGRRLLRLIEDMLTMSEVEEGRFRLSKTPLDLRDPVRSAAEAIGPTLDVHQLLLDIDIGPRPVPVFGDSEKLERVAENLLSNAAKFSHPGERVRLRLAAERGEAVLSVSDTGLGIAPEDQPHVFTRFFRGADAHTRAIQGLGLGLPIVASIVEGHGGSVEVESELGRGSTFVVRLPLTGHGAEEPATSPEG
jgi:signal transduction histidine kinase